MPTEMVRSEKLNNNMIVTGYLILGQEKYSTSEHTCTFKLASIVHMCMVNTPHG